MNFYVGPPRFLPPVLVARGWGCLAHNRRGHDVLSTLDSRDLVGGAYQTNAGALEDDDLARAWLVDRAGRVPVPIGRSHRGMLAAAHPDTPGLVLLSAHHGGPGIMRLMADGGLMAGERCEEMTAEARRHVAEGRGEQLMEGWWHRISAASYVDYHDNTPDILGAAPRISCPVLCVVGEQEPRRGTRSRPSPVSVPGRWRRCASQVAGTSTPASRIGWPGSWPTGSTRCPGERGGCSGRGPGGPCGAPGRQGGLTAPVRVL
jgi:hypothetical protein